MFDKQAIKFSKERLDFSHLVTSLALQALNEEIVDTTMDLEMLLRKYLANPHGSQFKDFPTCKKIAAMIDARPFPRQQLDPHLVDVVVEHAVKISFLLRA